MIFNIEQSNIRQLKLWQTALAVFVLLMLVPLTTLAQGQWTTNGTNINSTNSGNVGIGTANPTQKLHVYGNINSSIAAKIENPVNGSGAETALALVNDSGYAAFELFSSGFGNLGIQNKAIFTTQSTITGGLRFATLGAAPIDFATNSVGATTNIRMTINSSGDIGIGTTTPQAKLDVVGNVNATGTITGGNIVAKYQDVAEWVPASKRLAAGTVVILDSSQSNYVTSSSNSYDTKVAGVVSQQPGIALGESGANKVLVATTGRVKVKVDATHAPIKVGDLLVTSDKEGLAMKSEPVMISGRPFHSPGTLIGKALEPLANGTGEILVLLSLQ